MGKVTKSYRLLRDLPMYPAGTIVVHEYEILPSRYINRETGKYDGTYATDGEWFTNEGRSMKVRATQFLEATVKWCATSQRGDTDGWIQEVAGQPAADSLQGDDVVEIAP